MARLEMGVGVTGAITEVGGEAIAIIDQAVGMMIHTMGVAIAGAEVGAATEAITTRGTKITTEGAITMAVEVDTPKDFEEVEVSSEARGISGVKVRANLPAGDEGEARRCSANGDSSA